MKDLDLRYWQTLFRNYLEIVRDYSEHTVDLYGRELKPFFAFLERLGVTNVGRLSNTHLESYRLEIYHARFRDKPLAQATQISRLNAAKQFARYLYRENYLLTDIAARFDLPRRSSQLPKAILSEKEVLQLLDAVDVTIPQGIKERTILELFYGTAVRNSELRLLTLDQVDMEEHKLRIDHGKGRKARVLPVGEEAWVWLELYLEQVRPQMLLDPNQKLVFTGIGGEVLNRSFLAYWMRHLARRAGLEKCVTPHVLRHSCATHMLRRGANLRHLQTLLGHSRLDTTQIYTRVEVSDLAKALRRFHPREQWKED